MVEVQPQKDMVIVGDRRFRLYITSKEIETIVSRVAAELTRDYAGHKDAQGRAPLLLPVLNGAYMFAADLSRHLEMDAEISFVKMTSYQGMCSTGKMHNLIGFPGEIKGRDVIVVEDLVDTGVCMGQVLQQLQAMEVASARICSFLFKPGKFRGNYRVDYVGRSIDNEFIVGYGMDYNELGRGYKDIYKIDE